tara:strand:+ start:186 stop:452 length:267 start_codon:yes stop_codon:yes gene_type:complete
MNNKELIQQVLDALKNHGGKSSNAYAEMLGVHPRDVQLTLAELNRTGKAYSMPKSKNNGYSWHLNAKDMGSLKYKLTSQIWHGGINLG